MEQTGLVLEGGGMRGAYTAGVLDFFLDKNLHFPYVVGTSAGACNGGSYVARQRERNYKAMVEYGDHPEYISYKRMLTGKQLFGMDFIFDTLPNSLVPFDYEAFMNRSTTFVVGTTDMVSGKPLYHQEFPDRSSLLQVMRAASSLPLIAPSITYLGNELMDGSISDPIPIKQSIQSGNKKHVIVLTRNEGYIKSKMRGDWYFQRKYKKFPKFADALKKRHQIYNKTLQTIQKLESNHEAFVIRPLERLKVSRIERNTEKLHQLYIQGYDDIRSRYDELVNFIQGRGK
ncbi:patatin-like phospholipase family protein [Halobacillus seohaensis]|uniref:Patatin family protein n=1 Tax=Halobacillus seohaensis TaxID=447421 RepID=A0ABW2EIQ5_9BACI